MSVIFTVLNEKGEATATAAAITSKATVELATAPISEIVAAPEISIPASMAKTKSTTPAAAISYITILDGITLAAAIFKLQAAN